MQQSDTPNNPNNPNNPKRTRGLRDRIRASHTLRLQDGTELTLSITQPGQPHGEQIDILRYGCQLGVQIVSEWFQDDRQEVQHG